MRRPLFPALVLALSACESRAGVDPSDHLIIADTLTQPADGRLGSISGVAVDPTGRVVVVDMENAQIAFLDSTGAIVQRVGRRGRGPGEFARPRAVTISTDTMWVVDAGSEQVSVFTAAGTFVRLMGPLPWLGVADIAFNTHGEGLLAQHGRDTALALRVSGTGKLGPKLGRPHALPDFALDFKRAKATLASGTIPDAFLSYSGPALSADGAAWILRLVSGAIERYSAADSLLWTATIPDSMLDRIRRNISGRTRADTSAYGFPFPNAIWAGTPVGDTLWILLQTVDGETTLGRLRPNGEWLPWLYIRGTGHITAFAVDPARRALYLLDQEEGTLVRVRLTAQPFAV